MRTSDDPFFGATCWISSAVRLVNNRDLKPRIGGHTCKYCFAVWLQAKGIEQRTLERGCVGDIDRVHVIDKQPRTWRVNECDIRIIICRCSQSGQSQKSKGTKRTIHRYVLDEDSSMNKGY